MCGIVGLLVKTPALRRLSELMVPMLIGMTERGPDSAGLAVFGNPLAESQRKISVYSGLTEDGADFNWLGLAHSLKGAPGRAGGDQHQGNHAILSFDVAPTIVKRWMPSITPSCTSSRPAAASTSTRTSVRRPRWPPLRLLRPHRLAPGRPTRMATDRP